MGKLQFTIRGLLIATLLVAFSLPFAIKIHDGVARYFAPRQNQVDDIAMQKLIRTLKERIPPGSAKYITFENPAVVDHPPIKTSPQKQATQTNSTFSN